MSTTQILLLLLLSTAFALVPSGESGKSGPVVMDYSEDEICFFFDSGE